MPEAAQNQGQGQNQAQQPGAFGIAKGIIIRLVIIYFVSSLMRGYFSPQGQKSNTTDSADGKSASSSPATNIFPPDFRYDVYFYLSDSNEGDWRSRNTSLIWELFDLSYGDWTSGPSQDGSYSKSLKYTLNEEQQNNGSIYLHVIVTKAGNDPEPNGPNFDRKYTIHKSSRINKYRKRFFRRTVNLLTGSTDAPADIIPDKENKAKYEVISTWHENLTVNILTDQTPWSQGAVPPPINEHIKFSKAGRHYQPVIYFNDFWNLNADYMPINQTTPVLNFSLWFSPVSMFKWQLFLSQSAKATWFSKAFALGNATSELLGMAETETDDEDSDTLKRALVETSPYLLAITMVVSILHTIFEFLAFKNDIQFWRSRKSLEGLSVRSVLFGVLSSFIVVLYVMDNDTNMIVIVSVWISLAIDFWKIKKVVDIKINRANPWFGFIPRIELHDKSTYIESQTKIYDQMAFKYLSWLLYPLIGCYAVYSLVYQEHRGWYSWVLSTLYGFLLTFGFIMMTPQLFINYKMKSVAHLPWRMLTYKALNTFIDDLFAFVIRMPTLYRIGCLRDDLIFFIYLYQRWVYKIDPKRFNEYGTSGDQPNGEAVPLEGAEGATPAAAITSQPEPSPGAPGEQSSNSKAATNGGASAASDEHSASGSESESESEQAGGATGSKSNSRSNSVEGRERATDKASTSATNSNQSQASASDSEGNRGELRKRHQA